VDEFRAGLSDAWAAVATFLPKLVAFLLILLIGYFIAKAIARVLDRILERVGFDRLVERGGVKRALERSRYDASDILGKIVFYVLFLFVLQLAFGVFGPNPISDLIQGVIAYLPNVFVAIIIIVVAAAIAAAVKELIQASLGGLPYGNALALGASVAILVIGGFAALDQLQIAPEIVERLFTALLAIVAGIAIVAIGGGGIQPMRQYWERALNRAQDEAGDVRREAQGSGERIRERAEQRADQARSAASSADTPTQRITPDGGGATSTSRY
jgi:hypothetical protein